MLARTLSGQFRREYKLMKKRHKDMAKLRKVMTFIVNEQPLHPRHEDHPLGGKWKGCRECHIEPDWLLIYRLYPVEKKVVFDRTGSHSDLF